MKHWISYLFIVILTIFTLPVKQIGESLLKKNMTDQVDDSDTDSGTSTNETAKQQQQMQEEVLHKCILPAYTPGYTATAIYPVSVKIAKGSSRLIPHFVPDIPTPPPNFA